MKRFFTLLILFAATFQMLAQTPATSTSGSRRPLWVGLDMGGTWQTSDMKPEGGIGWSFTLSRYSKLDKTGPLYFGWRFRFLDGRNYGYNYHRLYGLDADPVLSSGLTDYHTPTANNDGYVFSNYRFRYDEFAYELIVGCNGLRKHGVLLYGFGGIGATHWKTTTNQLDAFGEHYDYSAVSTGGNDDVVKGDLKNLWMNGNYETVANGSTSAGKWGIMPSAGFGMGYQFGNAVAIGVEHRTTWALNDNIDGDNHLSLGEPTGSNDLYHYDGLFVRWTFGGGHSHSDSHTTTNDNRPPNPNNYTNNNPPPPNNNPPNNTTTVVNNPPNNNPPNNNPPQGTPPSVTFTTPSVDPYSTAVSVQQLVVRVQHVAAANQITLVINNQVSTNFSFNPNTNTMVFSHNLQNGTNIYQVTATNQYGSASDVQTIIYGTVVNNNQPSAMPPQVTITNPAANPYTSTVATMNITATVLNVTSVANVQVRKNGNPITNFSFDPNSHQVTFTANLSTGANLYEVIGTNSVGSASDNVTINYNPVASVQPPVVTITAPNVCPFSVKVPAYTITANITNVTAANQVSVVFNNQAVTQFNFVSGPGSANISFPVTLNPGANPFSITGTNSAGSNTKSCEITLKTTQAPPVDLPPVVTITIPSANPFISTTTPVMVTAQVLNITMANQITVRTLTGVDVPFSFNAGSHLVTFTANLVSGSNYYNVTATNTAGTASDNTTIKYVASSGGTGVNPPGNTPVNPRGGNNTTTNSASTSSTNNSPVNPGGNPAPAAGVSITLLNPTTSSYNTSSQELPITMTVNGVNASNEISVRVNGLHLMNFVYNTQTHILSFTASLTAGANTIEVTAQNSNGNASQTLNVTYAATGRSGSSGTDGNRSTGGTSNPRSSSSSSSSTSSSSSSATGNPATQPKKPETTTGSSSGTKPETKPATTTGTTSGGRPTTTAPTTTTVKPR